MQRENRYVSMFHRDGGQLLWRSGGFSDSGVLVVVLCNTKNPKTTPNPTQKSLFLMECGEGSGITGKEETNRCFPGGTCTQRLWWGKAEQREAVTVQKSWQTRVLRLLPRSVEQCVVTACLDR